MGISDFYGINGVLLYHLPKTKANPITSRFSNFQQVAGYVFKIPINY